MSIEQYKTLPVIILAGGFGTRLRTVVGELPKVLAPVCGRPFLEYLFNDLLNSGFNNIILSLHYKAEQIIKFLKEYEHAHSKIKLQYVIEPKPMGTGGALRYVVKELNLLRDLIAMNGDTYAPGAALTVARNSKQGRISMGVLEVEETERFGTVVLNENGAIGNMLEKDATSGSHMINCGVYRLNGACLMSIQNDVFSLERDFFPRLALRGELQSVTVNSEFIDIGVPEDYRRLCRLIS